jgi:hypothetical protein
MLEQVLLDGVSAAMVLPVIPFLCLVWLSITRSAQCGRAAS